VLTLNGKKFALNNKEFTESVFKPNGTCSGYYKPLKKQIKLYDTAKKLIGVITNQGVLAKATIQENGKYWYSYGTIEEIGNHHSYAAQKEEIEKALENNNISQNMA